MAPRAFLADKLASFAVFLLKIGFFEQQKVFFVEQVSGVAPRLQVFVRVLIHEVLANDFAAGSRRRAAQRADKLVVLGGVAEEAIRTEVRARVGFFFLRLIGRMVSRLVLGAHLFIAKHCEAVVASDAFALESEPKALLDRLTWHFFLFKLVQLTEHLKVAVRFGYERVEGLGIRQAADRRRFG